MPGVDVSLGIITVPIWVAGAAAAAFLVTLVLAFSRAEPGAVTGGLFRLAVVALGVYAGWVYLHGLELQDHATERRAFDERVATLVARSIAPGSALACLDELAGEMVETACEKAVFASPEAVAAAVSYVTAKLGLLADEAERAQRGEPAGDLAALRDGLENDRFGIVAHVLSRRESCTAEHCGGLTQLRDPSRVLANLRERAFEQHVAQYAPGWNVARGSGESVGAAMVMAVPPSNPTPSPATVSPRYDFPSSQSIPPVSIMAPEPPRQSATTAEAPVAAGATPIPPRRPAQVRAAAPRPAAPRAIEAVPAVGGDAATDAAANR